MFRIRLFLTITKPTPHSFPHLNKLTFKATTNKELHYHYDCHYHYHHWAGALPVKQPSLSRATFPGSPTLLP